jgi:hypothetical protein
MSAPAAESPTVPGTLLKALQASGLALRAGADGSLQASAERLELRNLALQTAVGAVNVTSVTLSNAVLELAGGSSGAAFELRRLTAEQVQIDDAELVPAAGAPALPGARLEPLGTVQGRLQVCIRDATWVIDAEITIPVVAGRIDFDRVVVEHVGPNSSMGIATQGIYVDAPNRDRTELMRFAAPSIPGVRYEQRGGFAGMRIVDRGSIDLRAFAEAMLGTPLWRLPERDVQAMLDRTKLMGDLQLADGALGTVRDHIVLAGRAQGTNGIALTAAVLGQRLVMRWPQLSASGAVFEFLGRRGTTGEIAGAVDAHVTGLSGDAPQVTVKVNRMTIRGVNVG